MPDPPHEPDSDPDTGAYPGTPRWVKVFGMIVVVLILVFVILQLTGIGGRHGPGRHLSVGEPGDATPSSRVAEAHAPPGGLDGRTAPEAARRRP